MTTRLRKINRNIYIKLIAFFITIVLIFFTVVVGFNLVDQRENLESVIQREFIKSNKMYKIYQDYLYELMNVLISNEKSDSAASSLKRLENTNGIFYYVNDGENEISNIGDYDERLFSQLPTRMNYSNHQLIVTPNLEQINDYYPYSFYLQMSNNYSIDFDSLKLSIGFSDEYLSPLMKEWSSAREYSMKIIALLVIMLFISLISFIFLLINTGKVFDDEDIHLNWFDRVPTDVNIIIIFLIIFLAVCGLDYLNFYNHFVRYIVATIVTLSFSLILVLFLSLLRHIKNGSFIKRSLIYMILHKICTVIRNIFCAGSLMLKATLIMLLFAGMCAIGTLAFPLIILIIIIAFYFIYKYVKDFEILKNNVRSIKDGDLKNKVSINGKGEIAKLQNDINDIADGLNSALEEKLKSERFKTELISNVSHDLKTPLTSIINYVDLLKKEGTNSDNFQKYLDILDKKSQRLKNLVDDLVEASKATTGNIKANFQKIEIQSFIEQVLGELDEKINESSLTFKINMPKDKLYVSADGKLLFRVVENLISNVLKYSYPSSRVYIDVEERNDKCILSIKNISSYELNVNPDELLQRFARGDESRNTDGNGLGLSIAKSFVELQRGNFSIEIDGDLFKAIVTLNVYK